LKAFLTFPFTSNFGVISRSNQNRLTYEHGSLYSSVPKLLCHQGQKDHADYVDDGDLKRYRFGLSLSFSSAFEIAMDAAV